MLYSIQTLLCVNTKTSHHFAIKRDTLKFHSIKNTHERHFHGLKKLILPLCTKLSTKHRNKRKSLMCISCRILGCTIKGNMCKIFVPVFCYYFSIREHRLM